MGALIEKLGRLSGNVISAAPGIALLLSAFAYGDTWHEPHSSTGMINGTAPSAESVSIPVALNESLLNMAEVNAVSYAARPDDFSADTRISSLTVNNAYDAEGDLFSIPPELHWEGQEPTIALTWANADTPETPLDPQPVSDKSFCEQGMAGSRLVVWPALEQSSEPLALLLFTLTGEPNFGPVALFGPRVRIDVAAAAAAPIAIESDAFDEALKAVKAKVGERITLTITTLGCDGSPSPNTAFVITRSDAVDRQGEVSSSPGVYIDSTPLTGTTSKYQGVTDANGKATVTVKQDNGYGVKTTLTVRPKASASEALQAKIDVIFTVITSPDTPKAHFWGHMPETITASGGLTFERPRLTAELPSPGEAGSVYLSGENWAELTFVQAEKGVNGCASGALPFMKELKALYDEYPSGKLKKTFGLPDRAYWTGDAKRQGSTVSRQIIQLSTGVMNTVSLSNSNSTQWMFMCLREGSHPQPAVMEVTSPSWDANRSVIYAKKGEDVSITVTVRSADGRPVEGAPFAMQRRETITRSGIASQPANLLVTPVAPSGQSAGLYSSPWYGVTNANGQAEISISFAGTSGYAGLKDLMAFTMQDADGVEQTTNLIFASPNSPDSDKATYWGYMPDTVEINGKTLRRPPIVAEAQLPPAWTYDGINGDEFWAYSYYEREDKLNAVAQCGSIDNLPDIDDLTALKSIVKTLHWPDGDYLTKSTNDKGEYCTYNNYMNCGSSTQASGRGLVACVEK
ncbi:adhesion domain-containing protein [Leminorella grimontii]|uniref:adhesion domain-containing protein n=1 Tax=Leminorella grimontii TaxID=82981 RepID=UPI0020802981|nr:DUF823 domain-containing adhesin [Leminorella grimontii]GKX57774.1 hypothetical protein SOASR031_00890 [Leminorella grimontii]